MAAKAVGSLQKTAPADPPALTAEITELRDRLLETCDFENVPLPKLIAVHDHLPSYVRSCLSDQRFQQANAARSLTDAVETEIMRQSRICDAHRAKLRLSRVLATPPDPLFADFDAETRRRADAMADRHSRLLAELDSVWASSVSRRYREATSQLCDMRAQYSRSPDPALANAIALREAKERDTAARQYADDYARAQARMVERFRAEAAAMRALRGKQRIFIVGRSAGMNHGPIDPSPIPSPIMVAHRPPFSWAATYSTRQRLIAARANAASFAATTGALPPLADAAVQLEEDELPRPDTPLVMVGDNLQLVPMAAPGAEEEEQRQYELGNKLGKDGDAQPHADKQPDDGEAGAGRAEGEGSGGENQPETNPPTEEEQRAHGQEPKTERGVAAEAAVHSEEDGLAPSGEGQPGEEIGVETASHTEEEEEQAGEETLGEAASPVPEGQVTEEAAGQLDGPEPEEQATEAPGEGESAVQAVHAREEEDAEEEEPEGQPRQMDPIADAFERAAISGPPDGTDERPGDPVQFDVIRSGLD